MTGLNRTLIAGGLVLSQLLSAVTWGEEKPTPPKAVTFEPAIQADQMRPHIEFLAGPKMEGRASAAKEQARDYIVERLKAAKLQPLFSEPPGASNDKSPTTPGFLQAIPGAANEDGSIPILGHNIGAWLPGSDPKLADEIVIVSAHYDHLGVRDGQVFAGADDNASGVAMLLEVARQMATAETKPKRCVAFISFDLEERMLWGSKWFVAHSPWPIERVKLFITADMIGRSLGDLPLPAVFVLGSEHAAELKTALALLGTPPKLEVCRLGADLIGTRSDYGPFRDREVPFLFFSTGEHPDYHTPRDTPDKIDYEKAARIASLILKLSRHVADAEQPPVWKAADRGDLDEPRALHRITTLILDVEKERPLTSTQKFMVTNVRNRTQQILKAEKMSADDRSWLIRSAQLLMVSVF
ncbi:MAG: M20/M25/M40 family metallo-hydrolase [Candidatus Saccharimonas sp.]|nr:M20/M25/M40 family metallo-hydrolase [Planctomycetaceae bacterium]